MKLYSAIAFLFWIVSFGFAQDDYYHPELEWHTIETEHFYVHYHEGAEHTAGVVSKIAEEIFNPVTELYNYRPEGKVNFIIKDYDDYSNGGTYFFDNKIEIWTSSMDFDLRGTHNWLRNVISHEFTHLVQIQTSLKFGRRVPAFYLQWLGYESERRPDVLYGYPNVIASYPVSGYVVPAWYAEGVAQYNRKEFEYDYWDSHRDMILRMYVLDGNMLTWNEMSIFGKTSLGNESSYNAGFSLVRYIALKYGENKLLEISHNLSSLTVLSIDQAIENSIGRSGKQLYKEWQEYLKSNYLARTREIKGNLVTGDTVASVGFANFYPSFSPGGEKIAYLSNKDADYLSLTSLYLYDVATKTEKLLQKNIRSNPSWTPDGKRIYYSKITHDNKHWSALNDIYMYDCDQENETRLTHGLRANSPAVSPDGKRIAFVSGNDGTLNLFTMNTDGTGTRKLTDYKNGEQVYNPKWSPDGKNIVFDYSVRDGRDIALISSNGGEVTFVIASAEDERNPVYNSTGSSLIYASDKTGIFNLYEMNLETKKNFQLTNLLGGAFMPTVNHAGQIAFSSYTSSGYKISMLRNPEPLENAASYGTAPDDVRPVVDKSLSGRSDTVISGWQRLRNYDDTRVSVSSDKPYKAISTSLSVIPFLRVDNYNPKNKGIDIVKPGAYIYSYDMLDRYGFFAGGAVNLKGERDLFFIFDYRGKIPGLFQLGSEPSLSLEAYNITRKTGNFLTLREDLIIPVDITYNMLEFDVRLKQDLFIEKLNLEIAYTHSRYNASIGTFTVHDILGGGQTYLFQSFGKTYLKGNDFCVKLKFDGINPSVTQDINPVGMKISLKYDYEFSSFNPKDTIIDGELIQLYQKPKFHRLEINCRENIKLPCWNHVLSGNLRGGTIFGPPVDDFFNFYLGGLAGMKGYPFYSVGGNEFAMANLTYRFPMLDKIDTRILHMIFNRLYGAVYSDVGTAWMSGGIKQNKFRRDAGLELRLEAYSYYAFPTRIFFNATYAIDKFDYYVQSTNTYITYGKDWSFHFGVLFGFDLD